MNLRNTLYKALLLSIIVLLPAAHAFALEKMVVMNLVPGHGIEESIALAMSEEARDTIFELGQYEIMSMDDFEQLAVRNEITDFSDCNGKRKPRDPCRVGVWGTALDCLGLQYGGGGGSRTRVRKYSP